ncbi:MAG: DinB family protein, partial [Cytophagales bacterium]
MKFSLDKSLEILKSTPNVISVMLQNLSDEWTNGNEGENTWTAKEVVAHLIVCEETDWLPRIKIILNSPETVFSPIDMQAHFEIAKNNELQTLLNVFKEHREMCLNQLKSFELSESDFLKTGIHPKCGEVTLQQVLSTWVAHDMSHIAQIARIIAKQNSELV